MSETETVGSGEPEPRERLADLLALERLDELSAMDVMPLLGELINLAGDLGDEPALDRALAWSERLESRGLPGEPHLVNRFFRSNIWASRADLNRRDMWAWDQPELQEQVLLLRRILADHAFPTIHGLYRTQSLTNLGSTFSTLGRIVEAVELRDRALQVNPKFGMALGNRAKSLAYYASALYQRKDQQKFIAAAATGYADATAEGAYYENDYAATIIGWCEEREKWTRWLKQNPLDTPDRQSVWPESAYDYRDWCATERLFLPPLTI